MFLADYHSHTNRSPDGKPHATYTAMAEAAARAGLAELCITEHCECNGFYLDAHTNIGFTYDAEACLAELCAARKATQGRIALPRGVEIGQATQVPALARQVLEEGAYDFVIGSLHNIRGQVDFCLIDYQSEAHCRELLQAYLDELEELVDAGGFDVLGHVDYPLRYMRRRFDASLRPLEARLRAVFTKLARTGRGIELNTKSSRGAAAVYTEQDYLLRLYRDCGGRVLTLGSDAHCPEDVGAGLSQAAGLALSEGFDCLATFRDRKPILHPIK